MRIIIRKFMLDLSYMTVRFCLQQTVSGTNCQLTIETLNHFLLSNRNIKIPKYSLYGNRLEQIMHTRLNTECSALDYYLYRRHLIPSPNCVCGAIENNNHYLLRYPRYNDIRDEMINTVLRYTNVTAEHFCRVTVISHKT